MNDEDVVKAVRWRYRICNYLFTLGAVWMAIGAILGAIAATGLKVLFFTIEMVGFGIFSSAFAMSLAIYRCPACDHFLSRFRPRKDLCGHCGARVALPGK